MFKKFKDKLAEEMKQSPARLQASMQQLAQVVSPALSNTSIQDLPANDNFSLTEETDETPKNSPARHGFQTVELTSPSVHSTASRRSSLNSVTSDVSFSFPAYENRGNPYLFDQSDMESASDLDESLSLNLDRVTKDQLYTAYRKMQTKYHKYRGRFTDLASHYKDMERSNTNLEAILVKSQDTALKRISDLKEQCHLEQQAKAHLEEALRNDIEEKDHVINTLNTKIKLLQEKGPVTDSLTNLAAGDHYPEHGVEMLVDLSVPEEKQTENSELSLENEKLKEKVQKMEAFLQKYKEMLKRSKEKITELMEEKNTVDRDFEVFKKSNTEKLENMEKQACAAQEEVLVLKEEIDVLKKREEDSVISLAENKLSIHRELEVKEEQIKKLRSELNQTVEIKQNLSNAFEMQRKELEAIKIINNQSIESEKEKSEALKRMQADMQQKLIDLEEKMGSKYHEEVSKNKELLQRLEEIEKEDSESVFKLKNDLTETENREKLLKDLLDEEKSQVDILSRKIQDLELICAELQVSNAAQKEQHTIDSNIAEEFKKLLSEKDSKVEECVTELQKLEENIAAQNKELDILRNSAVDESNKVELESYRKEIEFLRKEKRTLIDALNKCKLVVQYMRDDYVNLKKNVNSNLIEGKDAINETVKTTFDVLFRLNAKEKVIEELTMKCSAAEASLVEFTDKYSELTLQNKKLVSENEDLQSKIFQVKEETYKEIQSLKTELLNEKEHSSKKDIEFKNIIIKYNEYEENSAAMNCQNEKLLNELEESKHLYVKLMKDKDAEVSSLTETMETTQKELRHSYNVMMADNAGLKSQVSHLSEKVFSLETEISVKVCELAECKSQFDALIKESEEMRYGRGEMTKLNEDLDHATTSLKEKLQELEKENKDIQEENNNLWQQLEVYKNQLCDVKSNVDIYREKYDEVNLRNSELTSILNEAEDYRLRSVAEIEELTSGQAIRRELEESMDALTKENKRLHEDINESNNLLKNQEKINSDVQKRLLETESEVEDLRNKNIKLEERLVDSEMLKVTNANKIEEICKLNITIEENRTELNRRKAEFEMCLKENDTMKNSVVKSEKLSQEIEILKSSLEESKIQIDGYKKEVESLRQQCVNLEEELQRTCSEAKEKEISGNIEELMMEKLKLESHLDEALVTFQAKESQMQIIIEDLKSHVNKLKDEMKINEEEQSLRIKQLVKEFQAQLHDKEDELQAALDKRFDQQQNFESHTIQQYKEQLKDFQIELTSKSEQIESLILSNEEKNKKYQEEINKLLQINDKSKQEHTNEMQEVDRRWKNTIKQKEHQLETKHEHEITELTKEWQMERRSSEKTEQLDKELESTSRVAMAAVQSNTGSFQTLQHTVLSQRKELAELRKLVKLRHDSVEDSTEIEYLRNILYEYMMGKETIVLARVIAAVVKFDQEQTTKVLKKEEDKLSLLGSLGLT